MIEIDEIHVALGSVTEKNDIIENKFNLKKGTIYNLTGIKSRTIAKYNETAESLAIKACKKFKKNKLKNITHIISVTNTQNLRFPGISNFLSSKLALSQAHCLNLNLG